MLRFCYLAILSLTLPACNISPKPMEKILNFDSLEFNKIVSDPKYEFQMIYTEIHRSGENVKLKSHYHNLDTSKYFYPASSVKMPVAFLALQKLNELSLDKEMAIQIDSLRVAQSADHLDSTTVSGKPNIAQYIKKVFAVSDNNAYNRLYEFVGQDYINSELKRKGIFSNSRIRTRVGVSGYSTEENRYTNPMKFYIGDSIVYEQEQQYAEHSNFSDLDDTQKGVAYINHADSLIKEPFDMSSKNFINLKDLEACMMRIIIPEHFDESDRFDITDADYKFLKETMAKTPREYSDLNYNEKDYYDSYVKFFMFGNSKNPMPDYIRIHNKVGYAYGYLTDVAYIQDTTKDIEFFLTATVHVNENQIYNDGVYEYDELGIPFLDALGDQVYQYELSMKK